MSLKMECRSQFSVTQKGMSLNGMTLKIKCHLKIECNSKWNATQNGMSLNMECYSK